jgi:molybdopterin-guanine dinucleotide biosynthesis protein A
MPDIVAAILAGGQGRRIGGDKPLRRLGGERLIDIAAARVRSWHIEPAIVVRFPGQVPVAGAIEILDAEFEGPIAGLVAALRWAGEVRAHHVLILPCDTPALPDNLLSRLTETSIAAGAPAFARSASGDHPACAIWPVSAVHNAEAYALAGGRSLKGALARCKALPAEWSDDGTEPFFNINTPADLELFQSNRSPDPAG